MVKNKNIRKNKKSRKNRRQKGGNGYIRTNSLVHSTFTIHIKNETKSLYITIDGAWLYVIVELNNVLYCLTEGWNWNYFKIENFKHENEKITYYGDKYDNVTNTIILTNGSDATIVEDPLIKDSLKNWHALKEIKDVGAFLVVDSALDAADPSGPGCVIC
jgi:hypothetical protein